MGSKFSKRIFTISLVRYLDVIPMVPRLKLYNSLMHPIIRSNSGKMIEEPLRVQSKIHISLSS